MMKLENDLKKSMIQKNVPRLSLATNAAARLRRDHARTITSSAKTIRPDLTPL